jgi:hypothetical protein
MNPQAVKQSLAALLIAAHIVTIAGCVTTSRVTLPGSEIPVGMNYKITTVIMKDGEVLQFDNEGGMYVEREGKASRVIVGTTHGQRMEIDPEKVLEVRFEHSESSGGGSFIAGLLLGMPLGVGVFYLILAAAYSGH